MPENQNINSWLYARSRPPVEPMGLYGTRLSGVSYDFKSFTTLDSGEVAQFRVNSPESTAVQHMDYRNALSGLPDSFVPRGRLRRVLPQMTGGSPSRLGAVREVQIGEVSYGGGTLTVPCRIVDHHLRASGLSPIETQTVGGQTLRLRCIRRDAAWIESTNDFTGPTSHPSTGVVTFTIPNLSNVSGLCRLTVWVDAGTGGSGTLEPDQDGWATFDYPLQTTANLPVVELTASPDVGDDKNIASAKRATLQVTRSFATTSALTVHLTLPIGLYLKPGTSSDLAATYGFSGTADYNITGSSWICASPYTTATLTIPVDQTNATAQIVTRADQLTEQNLIVCRLVPDAAYNPGGSTNVNILIFDGPLWTLYPLEVSGYTNISSAAYALSEVNGSTQPRVGGYSSYGYYSGTTWIDLSKGGYWSLPSTSFTSQENVVYAGISTSPLNLVGNLGSAARVTRTSGTDFNLPHLANAPSEAWGIVSDASLIVGSSRNNTLSPGPTQRPVAWEGSGTTYAAVDVGGNIPLTAPGSAYGANLSKQVVGEISVHYFTGWFGTVAFRSKSGTSVQPLDFDIVSGVGDILYAPGTSGSQNLTARALAVNQSGRAVGYFVADLSSLRKGAFWPSTSLASDAGGIDLKAWKARVGPQADGWSVANSINGLGWIVGWSSINSSPARAVIKFAASDLATDWIDLNDPHFVSGNTGWVLQNATAVNDSGHIVGNGTLSSAPRGFILIPRTTGN